MLLDLWKGPLPSRLERCYQAARKLKDITPEGATWAALRLYIISRGGHVDLMKDILNDLLRKARDQ